MVGELCPRCGEGAMIAEAGRAIMLPGGKFSTRMFEREIYHCVVRQCDRYSAGCLYEDAGIMFNGAFMLSPNLMPVGPQMVEWLERLKDEPPYQQRPKTEPGE